MVGCEENEVWSPFPIREKEGMPMHTPEEVALVRLLPGGVRHTLEELVQLSGLSPAQVLFAVDRLSRSGDIILRKDGMDYHVMRSEAA
jgi:hypothetical protein